MPEVRVAELEQRAPVVFARRAGYPPAIFKPHERFDPSDPESFARLQDALADIEQANALDSEGLLIPNPNPSDQLHVVVELRIQKIRAQYPSIVK